MSLMEMSLFESKFMSAYGMGRMMYSNPFSTFRHLPFSSIKLSPLFCSCKGNCLQNLVGAFTHIIFLSNFQFFFSLPFSVFQGFLWRLLVLLILLVQTIDICQLTPLVQLEGINLQLKLPYFKSLEQMAQVQICIPEKLEYLMPLMMSMGVLLLIPNDYQKMQMPLLTSSTPPFLIGKWRYVIFSAYAFS